MFVPHFGNAKHYIQQLLLCQVSLDDAVKHSLPSFFLASEQMFSLGKKSFSGHGGDGFCFVWLVCYVRHCNRKWSLER